MADNDNMQVLPPSDDEQKALLKRRESLPKFTLGKYEGFNISREDITKINDSYRRILDDMEAGGYIPEELRSYMESVIFVSYVNEIEKKQRENYLDCEVERERQERLNSALTPRRWRSLFTFFRLRRNQAEILLDELVSRQARSYYYKKESELPISEEDTETEFDPYEVQLEALREYLPRRSKKIRAEMEEIISGLAAIYESKQAKIQRLYDELQAEKAKTEELTADAKKEAVKRLITCLNKIRQAKEPADWEILKLGKRLEENATEIEQPDEEETDELENWDDLDELDADGGDAECE